MDLLKEPCAKLQEDLEEGIHREIPWNVVFVHPLHASGYKSLLVSTEPSQNYEEDPHAPVFECAEAEGESCYYFSRAAQKNFVKIGILKKN